MGLTRLVVFLDQPVHYSGQTLSGRLVVAVDKPMSMKAIYLKYSGKGSVYWTETESRTVTKTNADGTTSSATETYTETYSNSEEYLALQQLVFGNDAEECELAKGEHVFIFNCQLPMNLPSSFEGAHGRVRYSIKATIKRSSWKLNHDAKYPVTVMSVCDLNHIAPAAAPVAEQKSKTFWGHSKPLLMTVDLPVRGFVPGQVIPVVVSLANESNVQIKSLTVSLVQYVTFHATSKSRTSSAVVYKDKIPVPNGLGFEKVPVNFKLPSVPASYLKFCKIIDVIYGLNVEAKVKAWYHKNLKMHTAIIVGNVPLMNYQRPIPPQPIHREPVREENPSHSKTPDDLPPSYGFVVPPGTMYEDLPPPTYEQSMNLGSLGKESKRDGVADFSPSYPVYKFDTDQG